MALLWSHAVECFRRHLRVGLEDCQLRDGPDGEEAITQWEYAVGFAECLERGFAFTGWADVATSQLIIDMRLRAEEVLRRARQRVKEAQQSG